MSGGYGSVQDLLAADACVILDGGIATELPGAGAGQPTTSACGGRGRWSTHPARCCDVHRALRRGRLRRDLHQHLGPAHALARRPAALGDVTDRPLDGRGAARRCASRARARRARRTAGAAVAFSLNGDVDSARRARRRSGCSARLFADEPPDLILLETLSLVRPVADGRRSRCSTTGLPVWLIVPALSPRRSAASTASTGAGRRATPSAAPRAASRRWASAALLVNCIPPDHVDGMVSYLRDFTDLPLGVYPNLGYLTNAGWRFETGVDARRFAALALGWRDEGAQIIGGCCGVGPDHIAAAGEALRGTAAGHRRPRRGRGPRRERADRAGAAAALARPPGPRPLPAAVP